MTTTIPPLPPGVIPDHTNAPLVTTEGLRPGDVVQIAVQLTDRATGSPFWWKRFACVVKVHNRRRFDALTLRMRPDLDKDLREVDLAERMEQQVVTLLPERVYPQGVSAMKMKALALGWVKLGHE